MPSFCDAVDEVLEVFVVHPVQLVVFYKIGVVPNVDGISGDLRFLQHLLDLEHRLQQKKQCWPSNADLGVDKFSAFLGVLASSWQCNVM